MDTIYVLLEKDLATEYTIVYGVYNTFKEANEVMEEQMTAWEELRAYKISKHVLYKR